MSSGYVAQSLETVKIVSADFESGYIVINAADFDEDVHALFSENADEAATEEAAVAPVRKRRG